MTMTMNEIESLTAGLREPLLMTTKEWDHLTRSLHTDAMFRMLQAGDWMSVDVNTGKIAIHDVCPETTQWRTRSSANTLLRLTGRNINGYLRQCIDMFRQQFAKELDGSDVVNSMALTYGMFPDEKSMLGMRWRAVLTKDFGMVVRGMEHSLL